MKGSPFHNTCDMEGMPKAWPFKPVDIFSGTEEKDKIIFQG